MLVFSQSLLMASTDHTVYRIILTTTIKSGSWKMMCDTKQDLKWFLIGHKTGSISKLFSRVNLFAN